MEEDLIGKKAELLLGGGVKLPAGYEFPFRISKSTAGPGAGNGSAVFAFGRFRVKKAVSYETGEFELVPKGDGFSLLRNGETFLENVEPKPVVYHSPEQAFFNLDQRCMFHCAFCTSPLLKDDSFKGHTDESIVGMVEKAMSEQKVVSVSLTSGVVGSVDETVSRFESCVKALRKAFPDIPIGVEPYVSKKEHVDRLKAAGANEIKINLESPSDAIFGKVCPELDRKCIWELLEYAVSVFGKGMVSSNMLYGLGETDGEMEECFEKLCSSGIVPTVRALRINDTNRKNLEDAVGVLEPVSKDRVLRMAYAQKAVMEKYGLDTSRIRTMCIECGCCDIVPFRDIV